MRKNIFLLIVTVLSIGSISAQKATKAVVIKGKVVDVYNAPVANAIIMLDDQKTSVTTDTKGRYKISATYGNSKIGVFSFGNGTLETSINGRNVVNFNFSSMAAAQPNPNLRGDNQAVGTGYGMVKKKNLTTDVSKIDGTNEKYATYSSLQEMIQREVSGVQVNGTDVVIQGSENLLGNVHPLIVVDGVYMDQLPDIPPVTVSSIEVLKGTSA